MDKKNKDSKKNEFKKTRKHNFKKKGTVHTKQEEEEIIKLQEQYNNFQTSNVETFQDFPLSFKTKVGLKHNGYVVPTGIQRDCIGLALKGYDILGAAKTGSGKTLAFLIPVLEVLFINKWSRLDGLGALIITPTRELALQIYETLCKVGFKHDFSAGLIIGGKDLVFERSRMHQVNIIICTPGRLLHHMDENPLFDCVNMKILVLDEADRCLDLGFEKTMNSIIENLPPKRQTLLFSATQTKNVKDLIRLSLKDPKYVSIDENSKHRTPESLTQSYVICEQHAKISVLWSFIKSHLKQKIVVFLSTCHQVKFLHSILNRLRPGVSVLALHGRLHQLKRMNIYHTFCKQQSAVLLATDIAARGLDFPEVNWVVQLDCPEDVDTYIHRAGRTARYHKGGECLIVLQPSENKMAEYLEKNKIPISEIKINPDKLFSPEAKLSAFLAKEPELKASAQRALVSYAKSVFLMKDKTVFDVKGFDAEKLARSMGLLVTPRLRFLQRIKKENNNLEQKFTTSDKSLCDEEYSNLPNEVKENVTFVTGDSESEDDVLVFKRKHNFEDENITEKEEENVELLPVASTKKKTLTRIALAKLAIKKKIVTNKKIKFNEEGEAIINQMKEKATALGMNYEADSDEGGINIEKAKMVLKEEDKVDKKLQKEKRKAKKREHKKKFNKKKDVDAIEEESQSTDDEADVSWLPDPEKVYPSKIEQNEALEEEMDNENNDEESLTDEDGLNIQEEEELALKLMSSKT